MSKDATIIHSQYVGDNLTRYLATVGDCGISLTSGLPILQEYYTAMGAGKGLSPLVDEQLAESGFFRLARGLHGKYRPITDTARVSFWRAFGIVPEIQVALEEQFRATTVPCGVVPSYGEVDRIDLGIGVAWCN
jgi:hypothetical protein